MEKCICQRNQTVLAAIALCLAILAAWLAVTVPLSASPDPFDPASIVAVDGAGSTGLNAGDPRW